MKKTNILYDLRGYLLLWGAQSLSELGTAMTSYALTIWVYAPKGTASSLTMLTLCSFLPTIFLRFIGGALADRVLEPYMAEASPIQGVLSMLFGTGGGAGTAVLFFCVGAMGVGLSLAQLRDPACKSLDR